MRRERERERERDEENRNAAAMADQGKQLPIQLLADLPLGLNKPELQLGLT